MTTNSNTSESQPNKLPTRDLEEQFSRDATDVARNLPYIEYLGSAMSHFQAEPLLFDTSGKPMVFSDWDMVVADKVAKKQDNPTAFPYFNRWVEKYLERSSELGENMFRFSLDFARLCPKEGEFNEKLMMDYIKALALIKANGQEPMLTIYHWPMPKYLLEVDRNGEIKAGGWEHPDVQKHLQFYITNVMQSLASDDKVRAVLQEVGMDKHSQDKFLAEGLVSYFVSINEPSVLLSSGYLTGAFPPFKRGNIVAMAKVLTELVKAHDTIQDNLKSGVIKGNPQVGLTHNWTYFDGALGTIADAIGNRWITNKFEREGLNSDFLGLQYYSRMTTPLLSRSGRVYSDHPGFGDIYPDGIYELLTKMNAAYPQKEIFVTEFGFSDKADKRRPYWILETMDNILKAKSAGIPVKGALLWSLVSNYEWAYGMDQKFGLFNESELHTQSSPSYTGDVRSWEAWRATIQALHNPNEKNILELNRIYKKAELQFDSD